MRKDDIGDWRGRMMNLDTSGLNNNDQFAPLNNYQFSTLIINYSRVITLLNNSCGSNHLTIP